MITLTQVLSDSHLRLFSQKLPFTRKPRQTFKIVLDPNRITSMKEGRPENYRRMNEDFPVVTTLTLFNRRRINVAESISVIEELI